MIVSTYLLTADSYRPPADGDWKVDVDSAHDRKQAGGMSKQTAAVKVYECMIAWDGFRCDLLESRKNIKFV